MLKVAVSVNVAEPLRVVSNADLAYPGLRLFIFFG